MRRRLALTARKSSLGWPPRVCEPLLKSFRHWNTHAKVLIKDQEFFVITSSSRFNFNTNDGGD